MRAILIASALLAAPSVLAADDPCRGKPEDEACGVAEEGSIQNMATQLLQSRTESKGDVQGGSGLNGVMFRMCDAPGVVGVKPGTGKPPRPPECDTMTKATLNGQTDCAAMPWMCEAPFHCDRPLSASELAALGEKVAVDGHANPRSWCNKPELWNNVVKNCLVDHDLRKSALVTWALRMTVGLAELDASQCFIEGHCSDTEVTYNTTGFEAQEICDRKYPGWTSIGENDANLRIDDVPGSYSLQSGFLKPEFSHGYGALSCAMGKYHCDVVYCKETFCKMESYRSKYGHLMPMLAARPCKEKRGRNPRNPQTGH